jgi:phosphatidate cytidylyltransferase
LLIGCLAGLSWLDHVLEPRGLLLSALCILLCIAATAETVRLLRLAGARPSAAACYVGALLPVIVASARPFLSLFAGAEDASSQPGQFSFVAGEGALFGPALIGGDLVCALAAIYNFDGAKTCATDFAASVLAVVYVGGTLSTLAQLRLFDASGPNDRGLFFLIATIAIVKAGDIGAYTVGRLVGRHKLAPRLSPGKTWEGAVGAVCFSCAAGLAVFFLMRQGSKTTHEIVIGFGGWVVASVALSATGMVGDLTESLLKRAAGVKDSSTWMPGFGGVLDILDSLMLAAPVAYGLAVLGFMMA